MPKTVSKTDVAKQEKKERAQPRTTQVEVLRLLHSLGGKGVNLTKIISAGKKKGWSENAIVTHIYNSRRNGLSSNVKTDDGEEITLTKEGIKHLKDKEKEEKEKEKASSK